MSKRRKAYILKSSDEIRARARDLRKSLGIDDRFAPDVWDVLNRLGNIFPGFRLKIVPDEEMPSTEAKAYGRARIVKITKGIERGLRHYGDPRARWTATHELGHLLLGHPGNLPRARPNQNLPYSDQALEAEANIFASEFLMPSHLLAKVGKEEISRVFQVSSDAAAARYREIKVNSVSEKGENAALSSRRSTKSQKTIFVSMAFTDEMTRLYHEILKPAIEASGSKCVRADEISSADSIPSDIQNAIGDSDLIVAEITNFNPNVMHEIGLAQSANKPTVLVCRSGYREDQIPSNVRHIRRLMYPNDAGGGPVLRRQLEQTLEFLVGCLQRGSMDRCSGKN